MDPYKFCVSETLQKDVWVSLKDAKDCPRCLAAWLLTDSDPGAGLPTPVLITPSWTPDMNITRTFTPFTLKLISFLKMQLIFKVWVSFELLDCHSPTGRAYTPRCSFLYNNITNKKHSMLPGWSCQTRVTQDLRKYMLSMTFASNYGLHDFVAQQKLSN